MQKSKANSLAQSQYRLPLQSAVMSLIDATLGYQLMQPVHRFTVAILCGQHTQSFAIAYCQLVGIELDAMVCG